MQYDGAGTANKSWFYADQQGSIVALANTTGAATATYNNYGPYGEAGGRFRYTWQQYIVQTGFMYYKARMYATTLGRFLQPDPIGYDDDINLYAYVGNDPVNNTDPTGQFIWAVPLTTGAIGAIAGGAGYAIGNKLTGSDFSWKSFGIAVGVGAAAGAAAPFTATTLSGAAITGAFANIVQGGITAAANSSSYSVKQAGIDALAGAVGGGVGGSFTKNVGYGMSRTAWPEMVAASNAARDLGQNVTTTNISRNVLGNVMTTVGGNLASQSNSSSGTSRK